MLKSSYTLEELAKLTNAELIGDKDYLISGVSDIETAGEHDASFLSNPRYFSILESTKAGVVVVTKDNKAHTAKNLLIHPEPSRAFQAIIELILKERAQSTGFTDIHKTAVIHPGAKIGKEVLIMPYAVIDDQAVIGDGTTIGAHTYVGFGSIIGDNCLLHDHVTIREHCQIGNRVIIQSGVRIGTCGFGLLTNKQGKHEKLKQLGRVVIEDDVEIGANSTIDRARFTSTLICKGAKIDNLVMVAHGVTVGEDNILVAQCGISGSTKLGKRVVLAGQTGVAGHLELGNDVVVAAKSGVSKSLKKPGFYGGIPAMPIHEYNKLAVHFRNLDKYAGRIKDLEKKQTNHNG